MVRLSVDKDSIHLVPKKIQTVRWYTSLVKIIRSKVSTIPHDIAVALITDENMRTINKQSRGINRVTDVLSFLYDEKEGEILIAPQQALRQYKRFKSRSLTHEIQRLLVHGCLHLAGFDHKEVRERLAMESMTKKILSLLYKI